MNAFGNRLIVVSNRLPFVLKKSEQGEWNITPGSGGLVTALVPVLKNRGGMWIGWPGTTEHVENLNDILDGAIGDAGYDLKPVLLDKKEQELFYYGYSNEVLWPLFHDLQSHCNFDPTYWNAYLNVNDHYAQVIIDNCNHDDFVWVHDYHLLKVAKCLRDRGFQGNIGFFLHIPFPSLDIFLKLPNRVNLLAGMLQYDLIGFQTQRDRRNFIQCVRRIVKDTSVRSTGSLHIITNDNHTTNVGVFPIGIDFDEFANLAHSEEVSQRAWYVHEDLPNRKIILGVDRLDYTKGIPSRFEALRKALLSHPELEGKISFIQVVVPSREEIPKYAALRTEIERLVGEINGQFTRSGWVPIHYIHRSLGRHELAAYYRTAEIALITPFKDGMNLVAKEFCASSIEEDSVLILSEFAGSAMQLARGAIMVNPYDVEEVGDAIYRAYTMPYEERRDRMRKMRRNVRVYDIFWWVDSFIAAAISKHLDDFPIIDEYMRDEGDDQNEKDAETIEPPPESAEEPGSDPDSQD